jgi:flagellar capping protein FliD
MITSIENSVNQRVTDIHKQLTAVDANCAQQAEQLQKQYNTLEVLLAQSNQTRTFLTTMINGMTNSNNSSSTSF